MYYTAKNLKTASLGWEDDGLGGWISPDGLFFQAHYSEHSDGAEDIVERYLQEPDVWTYSTWLERRGWIRLETSGVICHSFRATQQQLDLLYMCYNFSSRFWYKDELLCYIKPVIDSLDLERRPRQPVPPQGDQENIKVQAVLRQHGHLYV